MAIVSIFVGLIGFILMKKSEKNWQFVMGTGIFWVFVSLAIVFFVLPFAESRASIESGELLLDSAYESSEMTQGVLETINALK